MEKYDSVDAAVVVVDRPAAKLRPTGRQRKRKRRKAAKMTEINKFDDKNMYSESGRRCYQTRQLWA